MGQHLSSTFLGTFEMRNLADTLVNILEGFRERGASLVTGRKKKDSRTQKDAAAWMRDGYRTYNTPHGDIYV